MTPPEHSQVARAWRPGATPHPAAVIVLWIFLAIALQSLRPQAMLLTGGVVCVAAARVCAGRLYTLLRRTRWVMISLLAIYGYVTPGEPVWTAAGALSPTLQGVGDGALQLARLVFALAGLAIVLALLDKRALMGGIYALAYPVRLLGLSRERIAVRLALTLNYAEAAMLETAAEWRGALDRMLAPPAEAQHEVEIPSLPFTARDAMLVAAGGALLAAAVL